MADQREQAEVKEAARLRTGARRAARRVAGTQNYSTRRTEVGKEICEMMAESRRPSLESVTKKPAVPGGQFQGARLLWSGRTPLKALVQSGLLPHWRSHPCRIRPPFEAPSQRLTAEKVALPPSSLVDCSVCVKLATRISEGEHMVDEQPKAKSKRGFASMSPEKQREIASKGGKSVPAERRAFSNPEIASAAGKKGGAASPKRTPLTEP